MNVYYVFILFFLFSSDQKNYFQYRVKSNSNEKLVESTNSRTNYVNLSYSSNINASMITDFQLNGTHDHFQSYFLHTHNIYLTKLLTIGPTKKKKQSKMD